MMAATATGVRVNFMMSSEEEIVRGRFELVMRDFGECTRE